MAALFGTANPALLLGGPQISETQLRTDFEAKKFNIILVPGHDPVYSGAAFGGYTEASLNLRLSQYLKEFLEKDGHFVVSISRGVDGEYASWLTNYVNSNRAQILSFALEKKKVMLNALTGGVAVKIPGVEHNPAPGDTKTYLYALNKYGNEVGADLILHVHFNDQPRAKLSKPGKHTGFAIYVPEAQFGNSESSKALASSLKDVLEETLPGSSHPQESKIIIEDQELIAIGVDNQRAGPSFLVEYGYIYEAAIRTSATRDMMLREYAYQTYRGLLSHFETREEMSQIPETTVLPHVFTQPFGIGSTRAKDILVLQYILKKEGVYPPPQKTFSECPLSGSFGECTKEALTLFERKSFSEGDGYLDERTMGLLNSRYSR